MAIKLILVRHGQTAWNADGRFMGQLDIPLNETGVRQAQAVARRLSVLRPRAIYASDLGRAWQTAQAIQAAIGAAIAAAVEQGAPPEPAPSLIAEPRLREMHFGDWQGLTYTQIKEKYPRELNAWEADLTNCNPPGGENMAQMGRRVFSAVDEIRQNHADQTILLVAHGGSLQALVAASLGLSVERMWQFPLSNTGVSELQFYPDGAVLNLFNDTCHLEAA